MVWLLFSASDYLFDFILIFFILLRLEQWNLTQDRLIT
jgi:hypothetical protein